MKHIMPAMLAVAISLVPLGAIAGEPSAPMSPMGPPHEFFQKLNLTASQQQACQQIMTQTHQQMEQLHSQARIKVLSALTPAHRALLAQVVGGLAIATNPDASAAVKQLNAALSPGEAQAVLSTHSAVMQQMQAIMTSAHQRFQSLLTAQQRAQMPNAGRAPGPMGEMADKHMTQLTAGEVLLHFAGMGMEGGEHHVQGMEFGHPV